MRTRVVHCRRQRYDVYVGRPSPWGNPFVIGRDGTREEVIAKYAAWVRTQPHLLARIAVLRGKTLGCWCAPLPCRRPSETRRRVRLIPHLVPLSFYPLYI